MIDIRENNVLQLSLMKEKVSLNGYWTAIAAFMLTASTSAALRIPFYGLMIQPYFIIVPLALMFGPIKLFDVPSFTKNTIIFFLVCTLIASLPNKQIFSEPIKISAGFITFLFFSQAIRSEKDFEIVGLGFIVCAAYISYKAVTLSDSGVSRLAGINALDLGNKNAQSLYTLPGLFFASLSLLRSYEQKNIIKALFFAGAIFLLIIGIALSANRSGWVGAFIILLFIMIRMGISFRTVIIGGLLVVMGYYAVTIFAADIIEHKFKKTTEGYGSDERREELIFLSLKIGLEHPFFGVGFDRLLYELGTRLKVEGDSKDPHNLYGMLLGGLGSFAFISFFKYLFGLLYPVRISPINSKETIRNYNNAKLLLFGYILLLLIRALFTREILYHPNFMGGLGLMYSYLLFYAKKVINEQHSYTQQET